jgi:uncharacterized protein
LKKGETNLQVLVQNIKPCLNKGEYVFCAVNDLESLNLNDIICFFKEEKAITIILERQKADALNLTYTFIASWITLTVHSALEAVGLTAAFSKALANNDISCNVVAGYYHDHIFVSKNDAELAMKVLEELSNNM